MRIYRRGRTYWADYLEGDQRVRRSLGTSSRREAEAKAAELLRVNLAVGEILARWFEHQVPRCKPRSVDLYKIVRKRFSMLWGNLRPEELTTAVVEDTQETLLQVRLAPRSINTRSGSRSRPSAGLQTAA
jgi:hypothetical protein